MTAGWTLLMNGRSARARADGGAGRLPVSRSLSSRSSAVPLLSLPISVYLLSPAIHSQVAKPPRRRETLRSRDVNYRPVLRGRAWACARTCVDKQRRIAGEMFAGNL